MSKNSERVICWRRRTKERIVQSFGGKCGICNYSACIDAFDLHHLDPSQKEFSMASIRAWPKSWEKIVNELRKCALLCCRCHREVHAGLTQIPIDILKFDESFVDYKKLEMLDVDLMPNKKCPVCDSLMIDKQKTCSAKCAAKLTNTYNWDAVDLHQLFKIEKKSMSFIARLVGCSQSAVNKRLKKLQLL